MDSPPSHLTVRLEESDVREDLTKIVNAMSKIRAEAIHGRRVADKQKDEYLHLAYRLSSCMESRADDSAIDRMQRIADAVDGNGSLLFYDPRQDGHWKKRAKGFVDDLDDLLITFARDDLQTSDGKHHVFQALKYLGAAGEPFEEKDRVYNTILPFHGAVPLDEGESFLRKAADLFFGSGYGIESADSLTAKVDGDVENLDALIQICKDKGFNSLRVNIPSEDFFEFISLYPDAKMKGDIKKAPAEPNLLMRKSLAGLVKYTLPLYLTISGMFPKYLRDRFEQYIRPDFEKIDSLLFDRLKSVFSSTVPFISGLAMLEKAATDNPVLVCSGLYLILDSMGRILMTIKSNNCVGTLPLKLALWPLEQELKANDKYCGDMTEVEIDIGQDSPKTRQYCSPMNFFDSISQLDVPEGIEQNLDWGDGNHHGFGKEFIQYAKENAPRPPKDARVETLIDKKSQSVIYTHSLPACDYDKNSALFCFNGERYAVTTITRDKEDRVFQRVAGILAEDSDPEDKVQAIGKELDPKYVHFKRFEAGKLTHDYEVTP